MECLSPSRSGHHLFTLLKFWATNLPACLVFSQHFHNRTVEPRSAQWMLPMRTDDQSPFISDWPVSEDRERAYLHAKELYDGYVRREAECRTHHVGYGKWIIGALLAVHGGSLYTISNLHTGSSSVEAAILYASAVWNVLGIVFAILAALMAWVNFQLLEATFSEWARPEMLYRTDKWPRGDSRFKHRIAGTYYLATSFALLSLYCFGASASELFSSLI